MNEPMIAGTPIAGARALVTGASRGVGRAFVSELLDRGADRVYAASRRPDPNGSNNTRVTPVRLDITNEEGVHAAALRCADVSIVINNAGIMLRTPLLGAPNRDAARSEMETNYFGTLSMCRAFAPILASQGGGAFVNMLSVVSWIASPFNGSYCASKSAQWALTNAIRTQLRSQGTAVVAVHCDWIDTEMAARVSATKLSPRTVAAQALDAVESGVREVLADASARRIKALLPDDQTEIYPAMEKSWDAQDWPWATSESR